jgi:hypothetical protein
MALTPDEIREVRRLARLEAHAYDAAVSNPQYPLARNAFDPETGRFDVPASWPVNAAFDEVDASGEGDPFGTSPGQQ